MGSRGRTWAYRIVSWKKNEKETEKIEDKQIMECPLGAIDFEASNQKWIKMKQSKKIKREHPYSFLKKFSGRREYLNSCKLDFLFQEYKMFINIYKYKDIVIV